MSSPAVSPRGQPVAQPSLYQSVAKTLTGLVEKISNFVMRILRYLCPCLFSQSGGSRRSGGRRVNLSNQPPGSSAPSKGFRAFTTTMGSGMGSGMAVRPDGRGGVNISSLPRNEESKEASSTVVPPFSPPVNQGNLSARSLPAGSSSAGLDDVEAPHSASMTEPWEKVGGSSFGGNSAVSSAKSSPKGKGESKEIEESEKPAVAQPVAWVGKKLTDERVAPFAILQAISELALVGPEQITANVDEVVDRAESLSVTFEGPETYTSYLEVFKLEEAQFHKQHANYTTFGVGTKRRVEGLLATAKVMHDPFLGAVVHSLVEGEEEQYFGIMVLKEESETHLYLIDPYHGFKVQKFNSGIDLVHYFDNHVKGAKFAFKPLKLKKSIE